MIKGGKRCKGKKLSGFQCPYTATEGNYCHYCNLLVRGLTTPINMGFDPRRGKINGFDWTEGIKGR